MVTGHKDKKGDFHPHTGSSGGVSENDMKISVKGNNDVIKVQTKNGGKKGNRDEWEEYYGKRIETEEQYLKEKKQLEELDPSDAGNPREESEINLDRMVLQGRLQEYENRKNRNKDYVSRYSDSKDLMSYDASSPENSKMYISSQDKPVKLNDDWNILRRNSSSITLKNPRNKVELVKRFNPVTRKWQVYASDNGAIEIKDMGSFNQRDEQGARHALEKLMSEFAYK